MGLLLTTRVEDNGDSDQKGRFWEREKWVLGLRQEDPYQKTPELQL